MKNGNDPYEEIKAEFERKVGFLLEHQGSMEVRLQKQEETIQQIMKTGRRIALKLARSQQGLDAKMKELAQAQSELAVSMKTLSESQKELVDSHKHSDYKINALIDAHLRLMEAQNRNDKHTDEIMQRQDLLEDQFRKLSENPE